MKTATYTILPPDIDDPQHHQELAQPGIKQLCNNIILHPTTLIKKEGDWTVFYKAGDCPHDSTKKSAPVNFKPHIQYQESPEPLPHIVDSIRRWYRMPDTQ